MKGKPNRFVTLTVNPAAFERPKDAAVALVEAWKRCREMLKRYHKHREIDFLAIFEQHKSGWPHLHILVRSKFIAQKWLSKYMGNRIDSPIVDIRKIQTKRGAAAYVAKYIAKAPGRYPGCKRYWTSRDWIAPKPKKPKDPTAKWMLLNHGKAYVEFLAPELAEGYNPAEDILTGIIWDLINPRRWDVLEG